MPCKEEEDKVKPHEGDSPREPRSGYSREHEPVGREKVFNLTIEKEIMKGRMLKAMPWLLLIFGFLTLNMFLGFVSITCMVIGFVMLLERRWPEKWGDEIV